MLTISPVARCMVSRRGGLMSDAVWVLVPLGAFALVGWIVYAIVNVIGRSQQLRLLNQFQTKLLDRIGSVSELAGFLNTDAGSSFLQGLTKVNELVTPQGRILRAVQSGAVLTTLAIALYVYGWFTPPATPSDVVNTINIVATIFFGLGAGLLISARLSYRLSDQMGLLRGDQAIRGERSLPTV
jgi:hypothetical protein